MALELLKKPPEKVVLSVLFSICATNHGFAADAEPFRSEEISPGTRTKFHLPINEAESVGAESAETKVAVKHAEIKSNRFVPKSPLEDLKPIRIKTSVKSPKSDIGASDSVKRILKNNTENARSLNMAPLPLLDRPEDTQKFKDREREIERDQLTALWEATLANSVDINFVLQKLMPSTDPGRVTSLMMRSLSTLLYGGVSSIRAFSPGIAGAATSSVGTSILMKVLDMKDRESLEKARVTQVEQILLYNMVRGTADRLVEKYRSYKKVYRNLLRAQNDFVALKEMSARVREDQDPSEQFTVDYTLRKQLRELEVIEDDLKTFRQALTDLAGAGAVSDFEEKVRKEAEELYPQLINRRE